MLALTRGTLSLLSLLVLFLQCLNNSFLIVSSWGTRCSVQGVIWGVKRKSDACNPSRWPVKTWETTQEQEHLRTDSNPSGDRAAQLRLGEQQFFPRGSSYFFLLELFLSESEG